MARIGLLGGSFNPIHHAHLFTAEVAAAACGLERVLLVPAALSPFKQDTGAGPQDRLAMTRLAAQGNDLLDVCTVELERPPPSYSVDTVSQLTAAHPADELFLIMGIDALQDLLMWREPERLLDLCRLLVVSRPGFPLEIPAALGQQLGDRTRRIVLHEMPELGISSTEIRRRLAAGEPVRYLVPQTVEDYIRGRGLYGARPSGSGAP